MREKPTHRVYLTPKNPDLALRPKIVQVFLDTTSADPTGIIRRKYPHHNIEKVEDGSLPPARRTYPTTPKPRKPRNGHMYKPTKEDLLEVEFIKELIASGELPPDAVKRLNLIVDYLGGTPRKDLIAKYNSSRPIVYQIAGIFKNTGTEGLIDSTIFRRETLCVVSDEDRDRIKKILDSPGSLTDSQLKRLRMILLAAEGMNGAEIARVLNVSRPYVYDTRNMYMLLGLEGMLDSTELKPKRIRETLEEKSMTAK